MLIRFYEGMMACMVMHIASYK